MTRKWGRVRVAIAAAVAVVTVSSVVAFAMSSQGYPVRRVDANDSGVWVANDQDGFFGRYNNAAYGLDASFQPKGVARATYQLDIKQDGAAVVALDRLSAQASPVDVANARILSDQAIVLDKTTQLALRGGSLAALDPTTGKLWASTYDPATTVSLAGVSPSAKPVATLVPPAHGTTATASAMAIGVDGTVHAADLAGTTVTITPDGSGGLGKPVTTHGAARQSVAVTAVGPHAVVLDAVGGTLTVDGSRVLRLGDLLAHAVLQRPGPDSPDVVLATPDGLYQVRLDGTGNATRLAGGNGGAPASPLLVGSCLYAAWSGADGQVLKSCNGAPPQAWAVGADGSRGTSLVDPQFRTNHGYVTLNDTATGRIVDLTLQKNVDNWQQIQVPVDKNQTAANHTAASPDKKVKPKAVDDHLGARPGRTSLLHVLDNDQDTSGQLLAIVAVTAPDNPNATARISPDGQTIIYTLGANGGDSQFQYTISNGESVSTAHVYVTARTPAENSAPYLRPGIKQPPWTVPAGGTLDLEVLSGWRDNDSDPVALDGVTAPKGGLAFVTSDGRISLTAPATGGVVTVGYTVSDGHSAPVAGKVSVKVLDPTATSGTPAITEPDVATGRAGAPITIAPLANDIPGADPTNRTTSLRLAAKVVGTAGLDVSTDLDSGVVTVTTPKVGSFFLTYLAGFGSQAPTPGRIRVDVTTPSSSSSPVATPDQATVRGQGSALVDVLANDSDPLGSVLTVQSASAVDPSQLQVSVVKGRWVRVMATVAHFTLNPQVVRYTVTNGVSPPVVGVISVTQLAPPAQDEILAQDDYATVRVGDSTLVNVLANDSDLFGAQLTLAATQYPGVPAGELPVRSMSAVDPSASTDTGHAFVSGNQIRFVAPTTISQRTTVLIPYTAATADGVTQSANLHVTINPLPGPKNSNTAPMPTPVEERVTTGETVTIPIPASGVDPDGDSVSVVGIASAPRLGRVLGYSPTSITYQAYPSADSAGTDRFSYVVADRFGAQGRSTISVAVTPAAPPQPPVATAISMAAAPGTTVTIYPLTSAIYAPQDLVSLVPLDQTNSHALPSGVTWDAATNSIRVAVPSGKPVQFAYQVTGNAGPSDPAQVTVSADPSVKLPPYIQDQSATVTGKPTATVDVLANAYDPDGDSSKLRVTFVGDPKATVSGGKVTVPVTKTAQAIPYEVTDQSGAVSAAVIFVPAQGSGGPFLRSTTPVQVPEGGSVTVSLADYVADPRARAVYLTTTDQLSAGPAAKVNVAAPSATSLTITGTKGYIGPGVVVAEVTDGLNGKLDDPTALRSIVSIPVQVGPPTPVLSCPTDPIDVVDGGPDVRRDIMSMCSVWTPTPEMAASLTFTATWKEPVAGVTAAGGRTVTLSTAANAKPGATGVLMIGSDVGRTVPVPLNIVVVPAPPPTLTPVSLAQMKAGQSRTVDMSAYFQAVLKGDYKAVVSARQVSGMPATVSHSGTSVTITPAVQSHGHLVFDVTMTDINDPKRTDRQVTGQISFDVFTVPATPNAPIVFASMLNRSAQLSWTAPAANGAPIDSYRVSWAGGSASQVCPASNCLVTGLTNGTDYAFTVAAHNQAGWSKDSPLSTTYRPNAVPLAPPALTQTVAADGSATITWGDAQGQGSPVTYTVTVNGKATPVGAAQSDVLTGLTNGVGYQVSVVAKNNSVAGPASQVTVYAAGPPILSGPVVPSVASPTSDTAAVQLTVPPVATNGPPSAVVTETVTRKDGSVVCSGSALSHCQDTQVSYSETVTYTLTARTDFLGTHGPVSNTSSPYVVAGTPGTPTITSAVGGDGAMAVTVSWPAVHGTGGKLTLNGVPRSPSYFPIDPSGGTYTFNETELPGQYTVSVTVTNDTKQTATSQARTLDVYGPPKMTGLSSSVNGTNITFSWSADGQWSTIDSYYITWNISGGVAQSGTATVAGGNSGSKTFSLTYSTTVNFTVMAHNQAGNSGTSSASATTPAPPPPPPPPVYNYTVSDSYALGTCVQSAMTSTWYSKSTCQATSGYTWVANGGTIGVVCATKGPGYTVQFTGGSTQTWYWEAKDNTGRYVKGAVLWNSDGSQGLPAC